MLEQFKVEIGEKNIEFVPVMEKFYPIRESHYNSYMPCYCISL